MKVGLFIPCYMDMIFPRASMATLELLEKLGVEVDYPEAQTCCGQPMANTGCDDAARPVAEHFIDTFKDYEYIVCPSGSCTSMVRNHYHGLIGDHPSSERVFELCEFLVDILNVKTIDAEFPHKVGIHQACHGLRELRLGQSSERVAEPFSKVRDLLLMVRGIEIVDLARPDECCGFGGMFSVSEEAVSVRMGQDRIDDHENAGAEIIASADLSCLMHMDGLIQREKRKLKIMHVAEILNGAEVPV